jgi:hypothetical protein
VEQDIQRQALPYVVSGAFGVVLLVVLITGLFVVIQRLRTR